MGIYIRKSVSVGPFRLNLSKSGLGLSVGVKGFRVGVGPSGQYVHMGRGGIYYRKTFSSPTSDNNIPRQQNFADPATPALQQDWSLGPMSEYRAVDALALKDSNSQDLIADLNTKRDLQPIFPIAAGLAAVFSIILYFVGLPLWVFGVLFVPVAFGLYWLKQRDEVRRNTALFYSLDGETEPAYERMSEAFDALTRCGRVWRIDAEADVLDRKYHAGAAWSVRRTKINPSLQEPPGIRSNISVPALSLAGNTFYLFPDRILVLGTSGWGAVSWERLEVGAFSTRFVEDESVPHDSEVVDRTWRYVNKKGGPDRRFKDNREIPICLYSELMLATESGLTERLQVSNVQVAEGLCSTMKDMANALEADMNSGLTTIPGESHTNLGAENECTSLAPSAS